MTLDESFSVVCYQKVYLSDVIISVVANMAQHDKLKTLNLGVFKTVGHTITYADHSFVEGYQFPELPVPAKLEVKDVLGEGGMGVYRGIQSHPERE